MLGWNIVWYILREVVIFIFTNKNDTVEQPEQPTPVVTTPPHMSKIIPWALAIQHAEGGKPQDLNTLNHNPGNLKYTPYTASLGGKLGTKATDGGKFCYFDTYQEGFKALCTFLTDAAENNLVIGHHLTLYEFTRRYAEPPNDNYVNGVAAALGLPVTTPIAALL